MMKEKKNLDRNINTEYLESNDLKMDISKTEFPIVSIDQDKEDKCTSSMDTIMVLLLSKTGHDFSSYKKSTLNRRIERRMNINGIHTMDNYVSFLNENPQELELLFNEFLIGVTSFFREPLEWERLKEKVIPELLAERRPNDTIRVWVSGCCTGEEAYSLAIVFNEVLDQLNANKEFSMQIFATDLDIESINKAREGVYSNNIVEEMSTEYLNRYFVKVDCGYQVVKTIRDMVIFAQQNMVKDPPFTKIDILICRNVLIYLTAEMQKKLIPIFHFSLNRGGILFLGSAETVGSFTNFFNQIDQKSRIYRRLQPIVQSEYVEIQSNFASIKPEANRQLTTVKNIQSVADKLIIQKYSPATVLVNGKGDILYITGRTGKYLEPAAGNINWNIFAMAREGLYYKLSYAFTKALKEEKEVTLKNNLVINDGGSQIVDISVNPLKEPEELSGIIMIIFTDVVTPNVVETITTTEQINDSSQRELELERELIEIRQMWKVSRTEIQLSKEEFKSSNEELQSTNEELQSTNEELSTTKEEVQSLNEHLKIMNFEMQDKLDDLLLVTNDMKNQMDSMKIATLFWDNNLCVKYFTKQISEVSRLISSDVGRPITDIASDLIYPEMTEDIRNVLQTLITVEKEVVSHNGSWFNIRILPYQTLEDKIDGVVITYVNITKFKLLEMDLRKTKSSLEDCIVGQVDEPILMDEIQKSQKEIAACKDSNFSES